MKTGKFRKLLALVPLAFAFAPTPLWACAACTGRTDSKLAVAMNWGILTLLGVVLVVLSGALIFFLKVIRNEEAGAGAVLPENAPKT